MTIKVCGMRDPDNIRAVEELGVDWMGFIFWSGSSRYVEHKPSYLPTKAKRVGVFVCADLPYVAQHVEQYGLDVVQLHGKESPDYIRCLRRECPPITVVKALSISSATDLTQYHDYEPLVDYFLFDTKCKTFGGSGRQFDWEVLQAYDGDTPFLLSGGIGPTDAQRLQLFSHPRWIGIDLNSRFEIQPGLKDIQALRTFIQQL